MENDNNVNGNLNDNSVLDALVLTREQWRSGIVKAVIFTLIAVIIFFVPVTVRGSTDVTFGIIYKNIKAGLGLAGLWMGGIIIMGNGLASVYGKYFCKNKDSAVYRYYQEDSVLHPLFYLLGSIFALILMLHYTFPSFEGPAACHRQSRHRRNRILHCHGRGLDYSGQCCVHAVFTELRNRGFYR